MLRVPTYRKHNGNTASDGLLPCQICSLADPQVLCLSAIALPACHGSTEEVYLDALTRGQRCDDPLIASLANDVDLCGGTGALRRIQSGWTVGTVNHCGVQDSTRWWKLCRRAADSRMVENFERIAGWNLFLSSSQSWVPKLGEGVLELTVTVGGVC